ncbi:MAG: PPOX class F420-dependent oxidoreductase [Actinomycetota bacterium]
MIPASRRVILKRATIGHAATIGPDGAPQNNPNWFDWDGELIRRSQPPARWKLKNLRRDGRIALSFLYPENPYRYLEVRGVVDGIDEDADRAFIDGLARRNLGVEACQWDPPGTTRLVVRVRPMHTTGMG